MFILGMAAVVLGYALFYYSVGLWEYYRTSNPDMTALPLSYLFGFKSNSTTINAVKLPFDESGSTSGVTGGSNPITPGTGTGGSGVQAV